MKQYLKLVQQQEERWKDQMQECDEILSHTNTGKVTREFENHSNTPPTNPPLTGPNYFTIKRFFLVTVCETGTPQTIMVKPYQAKSKSKASFTYSD